MLKLTKMELSGYKSIGHMSLGLRPTNVLIGANGAGKSNFVSFFRLMREMTMVRLQAHVGKSGGANALLFYGAKRTPRLEATLDFEDEAGVTRYSFTLAHVPQDSLLVEHESIDYPAQGPSGALRKAYQVPGTGLTEAALKAAPEEHHERVWSIWNVLRQCEVFHFADTSPEARVRGSSLIDDNRRLEGDGANLASILYSLKRTRPPAYGRIIQTIRQVMPWFRDFVLEPLELDNKRVHLDWYEQGSDHLFLPHQLPDGALRLVALVTLLLQPPEKLPQIMVIDEPELGLHPAALTVLAALVKQAAFHSQIILATQSVALLDDFDPEDVVVVERDEPYSVFNRLDLDGLREWLEEYSLGELWRKNVLGGGPT